MFRKHSSTLTLSSDFIHIFPNYPCRSMPGSGAPIKPRARETWRPHDLHQSRDRTNSWVAPRANVQASCLRWRKGAIKICGCKGRVLLEASDSETNDLLLLAHVCSQDSALSRILTISLWPLFLALSNGVWPERCNWCWLQHHVHGSCCNFKSHLEGFTCEASRVSNSATLMQKKTWPSFFTPVIQVAPNTIHTPCWLGSSISQRQALLEPQGQSPELAINFHGSVHRPCWNLWKDCSFTSLQHPFVAFEVEGYLQIRTPRPKQLTHLKCCFSRI